MSSVHSENLAEQVAQLDQFFADYNSEATQQATGKGSKSSLEMLKMSCDQLQAKYPLAVPTAPIENKAAGTISSTYDNMSETQALDLLKKKILKDTTHCHLWMFLFDILMNEDKANVATWEDQKGMFRIKDPAKLAEMWGEKRNRTNMTYEKLSRSLRHYYEKKILRKVPKRKYTYKFNSREILKSYEVQPFYRRNSTSQSQRQPAKPSSPPSGQSSPYTPITPSPSYLETNTHFQWPQPSYMPTWSPPADKTANHNSHMTANIYNSPQQQQNHLTMLQHHQNQQQQQDQHMMWSSQDQLAYRQVPQPTLQYQMYQTPTTPTGTPSSLYLESSAYSNSFNTPTSTCIYTHSNSSGQDSKSINRSHITSQPVVSPAVSEKPDSVEKLMAPSLTLIIPPNNSGATDSLQMRQVSYSSQTVTSNNGFCRSNCHSNYTSCETKPSHELAYESDLTFNDFMESLAMEVF